VLHGAEIDQVLRDQGMALPVDLLRHRQRAAADLVGRREIARVEVCVQQLSKRGGDVGARRLS
jgi:hypothetical protein